MSKIINFNELKDKKTQKKYIIYLIFAIIIIYIFYSIYLLLRSPNETVLVDDGSLTLEESATGYIIREETVLTGNNYKNGLTAILTEGERAAKNQTIFRYSSSNEEEIKSKIEEINLKIQEALSKEGTIPSTDIRNLEKQIDEKLQNLNEITDTQTIEEYKKEIEEIISKKARIAGSLSQRGSYIQDLSKQKEEYEQKLTEGSEYINAPEAGVVSYRVDGLEDILTPDDFSNLTEESLENLGLTTGKIISTSTESGKIINNFNCYLATILSSESAKQAELDEKVTLSSGNEISANIKYIAEQDNDKVLIVFELNTLTEELIQYRKISFNITWWSYSGLKVPNTSIIEDEKGLKYVIRKKADLSEKVLVKVLKKNDKYSIISTYNTEELNQLGVDSQSYSKISQYGTILLYPNT